MILNPGEMVLFDVKQQDEVLGVLSDAGYKFWHGASLLNANKNKYGIRWEPDEEANFPNCLSTLDIHMAEAVRRSGQIEAGESVQWTILEYEDFMIRIRGGGPIDVADLI